MNPSQQAAFEAAAGSGMSPAVLNLLCIGALLAVLFLWAAWGLVDVYRGWANENVRTARVGAVCCPGSDITGGLHLDVCQLSVLFNLFYRMKGHFMDMKSFWGTWCPSYWCVSGDVIHFIQSSDAGVCRTALVEPPSSGGGGGLMKTPLKAILMTAL